MRLGDIISSVTPLETGWFKGILNGIEGVFPDNFVKVSKSFKILFCDFKGKYIFVFRLYIFDK